MLRREGLDPFELFICRLHGSHRRFGFPKPLRLHFFRSFFDSLELLPDSLLESLDSLDSLDLLDRFDSLDSPEKVGCSEGSRLVSSGVGVVVVVLVDEGLHDVASVVVEFFWLHLFLGSSVDEEGLGRHDGASVVVEFFSLHLFGSSVLFSSELEPDEFDSLLDESDSLFLFLIGLSVAVVGDEGSHDAASVVVGFFRLHLFLGSSVDEVFLFDSVDEGLGWHDGASVVVEFFSSHSFGSSVLFSSELEPDDSLLDESDSLFLFLTGLSVVVVVVAVVV